MVFFFFLSASSGGGRETRNCVFPNLTLAVGFRVQRRVLVLAVKLILLGHLWLMCLSLRHSQSSPWISEEIQNGHITLIT